MSILKLFFSAKFNLCFIHVIEWAVVNKFERWIFSCTFGIIFHLDHYSCVQHRFELSESWFMFLLSVSWQVKFCLTQVVTERNESWKQKMLNTFRTHVNISNLIYIWIILLQAKWPNHSIEMNFPFLFSFVVKKVKIKTKIA